jgi:hypothetical protein
LNRVLSAAKSANRMALVICGFLGLAAPYFAWAPDVAAARESAPHVRIESERGHLALEVNHSYCWIPRDPPNAPPGVGASEVCVDKGCEAPCNRPQGELRVHARERLIVKTRIRARKVVFAGRRARPVDARRRLWTWRVPRHIRDGRTAGLKIVFPRQPETYHYGPARLHRTDSDCAWSTAYEASNAPAEDVPPGLGWIRAVILAAFGRAT